MATGEFVERLEQAVREYIQRMVKISKTGQGITTDYQLDCPKCENSRGMEFRDGIWKCLWRQCGFVLSKKDGPPGPAEIKKIINLKRQLDFLEIYGALFR
jgi:ribosomal protein L37AE/L43A